MDWGMKNRLSQLIKPNGRCMYMPIDHGYFKDLRQNWKNRAKRLSRLSIMLMHSFAPVGYCVRA